MRWLSVALFIGCAPATDLSLPDLDTAVSYVIASRDPVGEIISLRAYDRGALPDNVAVLESASFDLRVLVYGRTVADLELMPDADGLLEALPTSAPPDVAWPLEPPVGAYTLEATGFVASPPAWTELFRVRRPPCAHTPTSRGIDWSGHHEDASFVAPLGPHVLIGIPPRYDPSPPFAILSPAELMILREGRSAIEPVQNPLPFDVPVYPPSNSPRGFSDGDQTWVLWPTRTGTVSRYDLHVVSVQGVVGPAIATHHPADLTLIEVEGRRFASGVLTVFARTSKGELYSYDEVTHRWTKVGDSPSEVECQGGGRSAYVLEIDGPGRAVWSRQHGAIVRVDLATPGEDKRVADSEMFDGTRLCGSSRATLATGHEIFVLWLDVPGLEALQYELASRPPGGEWVRGPTAIMTSRVAVAVDDVVFVSASSYNTLVALEGSSKRPDEPLRKCGDELPVNLTPSVATRWGERVFVAGLAGGAVIDP